MINATSSSNVHSINGRGNATAARAIAFFKMRSGRYRPGVLNMAVSFVNTLGLSEDGKTVAPRFEENDSPPRAAKLRVDWNSIARLVRLLACLGQSRLRRGARRDGLPIPVRVADGDNRPVTGLSRTCQRLPPSAITCHVLSVLSEDFRGCGRDQRGQSRAEFWRMSRRPFGIESRRPSATLGPQGRPLIGKPASGPRGACHRLPLRTAWSVGRPALRLKWGWIRRTACPGRRSMMTGVGGERRSDGLGRPSYVGWLT